MKDYILNNISMKDVLYKYRIKTNKDMFHCPFHKDKNASAKAYENSFYCFSCHRTGDVIQFVQYLYNLNFKEAMQKINEDFNLGLNSNIKVDYNKINRIKKEREEKEKYKEKLLKEYREKYKIRDRLKHQRESLKQRINLINVNEILKYECELRNMQWDIENQIEDIERKMTTI